MSEKKEIPEWIKKALTELQHHMTDDPLYATGRPDELIWWASKQFAEQATPIVAKHAPAYSAEDVERLVATGIKMHDLNGCDLDDPMRCDVCKNFYEALKPFQKDK